jgi:hypothetical protein
LLLPQLKPVLSISEDYVHYHVLNIPKRILERKKSDLKTRLPVSGFVSYVAKAGWHFNGVRKEFAFNPERHVYQADGHRDFHQLADDCCKHLSGIDAEYRHRHRNRQFEIIGR